MPKENESNIDLSEDLDINEIMDKSEANDSDMETEDFNNSDESGSNEDDTLSFDDINELDEELNIDDDFEVKEDFKTDGDLDLDSEIELQEIDSSENTETEDLDLQKDLGLEDKLSIHDEEKINLKESDFDFDLSDDEGKPIGESEEEYGVDIKSDPETINSFEIENNSFEDKIFPEQDEETLRSIVDDIEKEIETNEISDEQEAMNSDIKIEGIDNEEGLVIGEAESNELDEAISFEKDSDKSPEISTEELDIDLSEFSQDELTEEISETENKEYLNIDDSDISDISEELDEVISTGDDSEELPDISVEDIDNIDLSEITGDEFIEETTETENISDDLDIDLSDTDITSKEDTIETPDSDLSEELPDISSEEIDIDLSELDGFENDTTEKNKDITTSEELNIDLSEDEISTKNNETQDIDDQIDLSEIDIPSKFESEILDESQDNEIPGESTTNGDETIKIEEDELINIEENILPDDFSLPEIDNNIENIELPEEDALSESISSIAEAGTVLEDKNIGDTGNLDEVDLDNIPQPAHIEDNMEEDDTISLSSDELEKVTADAKISEDQEETEITELNDITMEDQEDQTEDSDLISENLSDLETEISLDEIDSNGVYDDLKQEMKEKKDVSQIQNLGSLKENIKDVLAYLDQLLDALPEEKIKEFAESKIFEKYKNLFDELKIKP